MTPTIIGISGFARTGKDTLAKMLLKTLYEKHNHPSIITNLANSIKTSLDTVLMKELCISAFNQDPKIKKMLRPLFVEFGELCRGIDEDFFIKKIIPQCNNALSAGWSVIIPDIRFLNEVKWLKTYKNSCLVSISREGITSPNEQEKENIPNIRLQSDLNIQLPHFSHSCENDLLINEDFGKLCEKLINENIYEHKPDRAVTIGSQPECK